MRSLCTWLPLSDTKNLSFQVETITREMAGETTTLTTIMATNTMATIAIITKDMEITTIIATTIKAGATTTTTKVTTEMVFQAVCLTCLSKLLKCSFAVQVCCSDLTAESVTV